MRALNHATRGMNASTDVLTLNDSIDSDASDVGSINLSSLLFTSSTPLVRLHAPQKQHE